MPEIIVPFTFGEGEAHPVGDANCRLCWHGGPRPCPCGGLIHSAFGDENSDGDYWLYYCCDRCGSKDSPDA